MHLDGRGRLAKSLPNSYLPRGEWHDPFCWNGLRRLAPSAFGFQSIGRRRECTFTISHHPQHIPQSRVRQSTNHGRATRRNPSLRSHGPGAHECRYRWTGATLDVSNLEDGIYFLRSGSESAKVEIAHEVSGVAGSGTSRSRSLRVKYRFTPHRTAFHGLQAFCGN